MESEPHSFISTAESTSRQFFRGRLTLGNACLMHVEGDREFIATKEMSVRDFVQRNRGELLLTTIELLP